MNLNDYTVTSCFCQKCKEMCNKPCWGTPEDIKKIIDAGYGDRLMVDFWVMIDDPNIEILCPASKGNEGGNAPWFPREKCTFQDIDGLCILHDLGLKPIEGKLATCARDTKNKFSEVHGLVAQTWKGKNHLIDGWRNCHKTFNL